MNLRITAVASAAFAIAAATTVGCGDDSDSDPPPDACERAVDHISDCGIELVPGAINDDCDARDECVADCITDASCETLTGEDVQGAQDYAACATDC
jgi:hypothetical protein